jgi:membrane-bound lytic murein transglycosylase B
MTASPAPVAPAETELAPGSGYSLASGQPSTGIQVPGMTSVPLTQGTQLPEAQQRFQTIQDDPSALLQYRNDTAIPENLRRRAGERASELLNSERNLARAEAQTGVPAEIVVGGIGVETIYGQHKGNCRVLDALVTLSLDFPSSHPRQAERQAFFKSELAQLLTFKRHGVNPLALKGSYAGAMGWPQFMPSSWNRFAVDFDGDGRIDLLNSPVDAIGSVAHYLKAFGWQTGMPTHYAVNFDTATLQLDELMVPDILPTFSVASFMAKGAIPDAAGMAHNGPLALIELQNGASPASYVAGTENFYVITRYNWSSYYAMAVIELGRAVAEKLGAHAR